MADPLLATVAVLSILIKRVTQHQSDALHRHSGKGSRAALLGLWYVLQQLQRSIQKIIGLPVHLTFAQSVVSLEVVIQLIVGTHHPGSAQQLEDHKLIFKDPAHRESYIPEQIGTEQSVTYGKLRRSRHFLPNIVGPEAPREHLRLDPVRKEVDAAAGDIRSMGLQPLYQKLCHPGMDIIVTVYKHHILAGDHTQPCVAGIGQAAVFLVDYPHPAVPAGVVIADSSAAVGAAIIYQDQFHIIHGLCQNALYTAGKILFHPVNRNDDANHYPCSLLSQSASQ